MVAGITHWRLHLLILAATFVLFPLLGMAAMWLPSFILPKTLATGLLFLCCLPSTVQSSIAFTSVARGNVAAAVCAASASNLFGIFITPVLVTLTLGVRGAGSQIDEAEAIALQLLAPFVAGQIARIWIARWMKQHSKLVGLVDRGSILLVVYGAFSEAVVQGIWSEVSIAQIAMLIVVCAVLLAIVLAATAFAARRLGLSTGGRRDRDGLLRLEEEPGHRRADGGPALPARQRRPDRAAADAAPPAAADGLARHGSWVAGPHFTDRPATSSSSARRSRGAQRVEASRATLSQKRAMQATDTELDAALAGRAVSFATGARRVASAGPARSPWWRR